MDIFGRLGEDIAKTLGEDLIIEQSGFQNAFRGVFKATTQGFDENGNTVLVPSPSCLIPYKSELIPNEGDVIIRLNNRYMITEVYDDGKSSYKTMLQDIEDV